MHMLYQKLHMKALGRGHLESICIINAILNAFQKIVD